MCKTDSWRPPLKYINPMSDYGFKRIFSDPKVMRGVITDIIQPQSPISELTFLDPYMLPDRKEDRGIIYDLRCKTEDGDEFIVEMQKRNQYYFKDRVIYYLSRAIAPQGDRGISTPDPNNPELMRPWNYELHPVYGIFFMNFHLDKQHPQPLRTLQYMDRETNQVFSDKVRGYAIELPCYARQRPEDCKTGVERWVYFINNVENLQEGQPFADASVAFERAYEVAELANMSSRDREIYMHYLDLDRSNYNAYQFGIDESRSEGLAEGLAKGLVEGMKKGREEGLQEGMEKGERQAKLAMAKAMKEKGLSVEDIAGITQLSLEEVQKL